MRPFLAALVLLTAFVALPGLAPAQTPTEPPKVSLDARGEDVREVFATLFDQVRKPYVLDAAIKGKVYIRVDAMPFPKALDLLLKQSGLVAKEKDGVTLVSVAPPAPTVPTTPPATTPVKPTTPSKSVVTPPVPVEPETPPAPAPARPAKIDFNKRVTTRLNRAPLATVFAALSAQTGTPILLDPKVPAYRVDAFFVRTSLRYALDRVCKAAGLVYAPTKDGAIRVSRRR